MDNQRSKLLISTKAQRSGRKMLLRAIGIIGICFGVLIQINLVPILIPLYL